MKLKQRDVKVQHSLISTIVCVVPEQTGRSVLTGYSVGLHLKVGDVVPGDAVALGAHAAAPGAHDGASPSLVDLV